MNNDFFFTDCRRDIDQVKKPKLSFQQNLRMSGNSSSCNHYHHHDHHFGLFFFKEITWICPNPVVYWKSNNNHCYHHHHHYLSHEIMEFSSSSTWWWLWGWPENYIFMIINFKKTYEETISTTTRMINVGNHHHHPYNHGWLSIIFHVKLIIILWYIFISFIVCDGKKYVNENI